MTTIHFFVVFFVLTKCCTNSIQALECTTLVDKSCTFSGIRTTTLNQYFHPSSVDNDIIEQIKLYNSTIPVLTSELCEEFPILRSLRVINVSMKSFTSQAFEKCKSLTILQVWMNNLTELNQDLLITNQNLNEIDFQNNGLESINGKLFENLRLLTFLNVAENFLIEFPIHQFPVLDKLEYLFIHSNNLTDLDEHELLVKFPNLKYINLNNNLFDCDRLKIIINALRRNGVHILKWYEPMHVRNFNVNTVEEVVCLTEKERITQVLNSKLIGVLENYRQATENNLPQKDSAKILHEKHSTSTVIMFNLTETLTTLEYLSSKLIGVFAVCACVGLIVIFMFRTSQKNKCSSTKNVAYSRVPVNDTTEDTSEFSPRKRKVLIGTTSTQK